MQPKSIQPPTEICNPNFQPGHQISAITERCNNVLNGTYGSSSKQLTTAYYGKK